MAKKYIELKDYQHNKEFKTWYDGMVGGLIAFYNENSSVDTILGGTESRGTYGASKAFWIVAQLIKNRNRLTHTGMPHLIAQVKGRYIVAGGTEINFVNNGENDNTEIEEKPRQELTEAELAIVKEKELKDQKDIIELNKLFQEQQLNLLISDMVEFATVFKWVGLRPIFKINYDKNPNAKQSTVKSIKYKYEVINPLWTSVEKDILGEAEKITFINQNTCVEVEIEDKRYTSDKKYEKLYEYEVHNKSNDKGNGTIEFGYCKWDLANKRYIIITPAELNAKYKQANLKSKSIITFNEEVIFASIFEVKKSDYKQNIQLFDILDENESTDTDQLRKSKTIRYIPKQLLIKNRDGSTIGMNELESDFEITDSEDPENGKVGKIETSAAEYQQDKYEKNYENTLSKMLRNVGLDEYVLGIERTGQDGAELRRQRSTHTVREFAFLQEIALPQINELINKMYMLYKISSSQSTASLDENDNPVINVGENLIETGNNKISIIIEDPFKPSIEEKIKIAGEAITSKSWDIQKAVEYVSRGEDLTPIEIEERINNIKTENSINSDDEDWNDDDDDDIIPNDSNNDDVIPEDEEPKKPKTEEKKPKEEDPKKKKGLFNRNKK